MHNRLCKAAAHTPAHRAFRRRSASSRGFTPSIRGRLEQSLISSTRWLKIEGKCSRDLGRTAQSIEKCGTPLPAYDQFALGLRQLFIPGRAYAVYP